MDHNQQCLHVLICRLQFVQFNFYDSYVYWIQNIYGFWGTVAHWRSMINHKYIRQSVNILLANSKDKCLIILCHLDWGVECQWISRKNHHKRGWYNSNCQGHCQNCKF